MMLVKNGFYEIYLRLTPNFLKPYITNSIKRIMSKLFSCSICLSFNQTESKVTDYKPIFLCFLYGFF